MSKSPCVRRMVMTRELGTPDCRDARPASWKEATHGVEPSLREDSTLQQVLSIGDAFAGQPHQRDENERAKK